jgi:protease-4
MSQPDQPTPDLPPMVLPVRGPAYAPAAPPPPPPRSGFGWLSGLIALALFVSVGLNVLLFMGLAMNLDSGGSGGLPVTERTYAGSTGDKVAVIRVEGVIMEGLTDYVHKQIDKAAKDKSVKAIVLRVESPGGTITASDDLHRRLVELRDGTCKRYAASGAKPIVVSMGNLAASGGYYIAMPGEHIFAERTTITGSIGVYASFVNVHQLADKYGIQMELVKAGGIKGAGSMFHELSPQERQQWQDMVDHAYQQFLAIVEAGRPDLKGKLEQPVFANREITVRDHKGNPKLNDTGKPQLATYSRQRADGGIYTAAEALKYGLVDDIGTLEDAVAHVAKKVGLSEYRTVVYDKPVSLFGPLGLSSTPPNQGQLDLGRLANAATPRLWLLAPQAELAGFCTAVTR